MQAQVAPTITAFTDEEYAAQLNRLGGFAKRLHIDLMDGVFAPTKSPDMDSVMLLDGAQNDIHLMYKRPMEHLEDLAVLKPTLAIVHYESDANLSVFSESMHRNGIKAGLAILAETEIDEVLPSLADFDHVLIFSGKLGYHGGSADLSLLEKVRSLREVNAAIEIGWDGGINETNAIELAKAGVDVLNVGRYIASSDDPKDAYGRIVSQLEAA